MSKPVKEIMMRDYRERMGDHEDALVVSLRGISSNDTNHIRSSLEEKDIRVTVVRNRLFLKVFEGTGLSALEPVLTGSNAVAYGAESVVEIARAVVDLVKDFPGIEMKGAVLDGALYAGESGVDRLSKFPTRDEAIAEDVTLILSPGRNLVGAVKGPGSTVAGIIKSIEGKLEDGETIAKTA